MEREKLSADEFEVVFSGGKLESMPDLTQDDITVSEF